MRFEIFLFNHIFIIAFTVYLILDCWDIAPLQLFIFYSLFAFYLDWNNTNMQCATNLKFQIKIICTKQPLCGVVLVSVTLVLFLKN